jgi:tetratricopeptide (TPR) repeat protein
MSMKGKTNMSHSTKGVFEITLAAFVIAVVAAGGYVYRAADETSGLAIAAEAVAAEAIAAPKSGDEYAALARQKSQLEGENAQLKAQAAQFDSEKNIILNQVRTSVKAFDEYRAQMTSEIKKMSDKIEALSRENESLKTSAPVESVSDSEKAAYEAQLADLRNETAVYKETVSVLQQELSAKEESSVVVEAGKLHYNVGNFYFRNREYAAAVEEYKKAIMYQPKDADAHYNLAIVNDEYLGNRPEALQHYKRFLSLASGDPKAVKVEQRILDLELYETVLASDKDEKAGGVKWLDKTVKFDSNKFYGG